MCIRDSARCEVEIFLNISKPSCNYRISKIIHQVWEHIPNTNSWVFAAVPDNEVVTINCKNNRGVMTFVQNIRLTNKGKLTLEADCIAVGSTFTLLSRDNQQKEEYNDHDFDLIIPHLNITPSGLDKTLVNEFDNFSKLNSNLLLNHVTHQMNDLNTASIRLTTLRQLMRL